MAPPGIYGSEAMRGYLGHLTPDEMASALMNCGVSHPAVVRTWGEGGDEGRLALCRLLAAQAAGETAASAIRWRRGVRFAP